MSKKKKDGIKVGFSLIKLVTFDNCRFTISLLFSFSIEPLQFPSSQNIIR